jgi:putative DNA primase/helicase
MQADTARAIDALNAIPSTIEHDTRARVGMAAKKAGVAFADYDAWQSTNPRYNAQEVRSMWHSFDADGAIGEGTLYRIAAEHGWRRPQGKPQQRPIQGPRMAQEPPRRPAPGNAPAEVWGRCEVATHAHPYIAAKKAAGVPLDKLRVVPAGDRLTIAGQSMAGALVVPAYAPDGTLQSLQLIPPPGAGKKVNLPGAPMSGASHTVGELSPGGVVYLSEGIGQAWACWQATGHAAVCCFGWGNVGKVAQVLRERDATAKLVICPDGGKEQDARKIAQDVRAAMVEMPIGWQNNSDVNDLAQRDGLDALELLLEGATEPPKPEPRYKLLGSADLAAMPPLAWRVRGVLPAVGLAGYYGPSASGKSFLGFDVAGAIADGRRWFDCRVEAAPVVYAALEGEAGFKLRVQAWEAHQGRKLPERLKLVLQPFKLTEPQDVRDLAAVVPAGGVVFLDTLNRAAPTADENSSRDMGEILEAAKQLQSLTGGLVVLIHHTGKDATKGLRGHSSLFAALDAAVEVSRDGDRREWRVAKSKDGQDGDAHPFKLQVETLGIDEHGDPVTSCVVVVDHAARDVQRVKLPQGGNQRVVLDALRPMFKDGATGKLGAPPLRPCIELEAAIVKAAGHLTCETARRATRTREAITGLVARGVLACNEGWIWMAA